MSYCTKTEVNNLFGDISDDISDGMFDTVIDNATAWIDSALTKNYVPIPTVEVAETVVTDVVTETTETEDAPEVTETTETTTTSTTTVQNNLINIPSGLRTAAIYYAASDILLSLYHGEELPVQYDVWYNKAQTLLNDYIEAYKHSEAEEADLVAHQQVKHSHSQTYNQKRGRLSIWER